MGGNMAPWGDADRPPIRISHLPQSYLNAGNDGAAGALTALWHRHQTGQGQQVDVSMQEAIAQSTEHITANWDLRQAFAHRGETRGMGNHRARQIWPCKDGFVSWTHGGKNVLNPSFPLIKWMKEEGYTNDYIDNFNWDRDDFARISQEEMDQIEEPTGRFFMAHSKAELLEGAVAHEALLYPAFTNADMLYDPQLKARKFWVEIEHPELNTTLSYPGAFVNSSEAPPKITRRAPLIGEHNAEIYEKELGISKEKLIILKEAGAI
jgi:crotonobetainyl-CoA:carnitine CoA-transferase CaiB-like acyl-CoA transferase